MDLKANMIMENVPSYSKSLEIYLQSAVVRGTLVIKHHRLSDYLNIQAGNEAISLKDVSVEDLNGNSLQVNSTEFVIWKQEVLFVADLSIQSGTSELEVAVEQIKKISKKVLLSVGPLWIRGNIYLMPGGKLQGVVTMKNHFIVITDAMLLKDEKTEPKTFLINQTKIGFMAAVNDD